MKTTEQDKKSLARSTGFDLWGQLCTSGVFLAALDSDFELAKILAWRAAHATNPMSEIQAWAGDPSYARLLNAANPGNS